MNTQNDFSNSAELILEDWNMLMSFSAFREIAEPAGEAHAGWELNISTNKLEQ